MQKVCRSKSPTDVTSVDAKKGLELSREYFENVVRSRLEEDFPDLFPRLAAGLAGNGSECFGYDDEISRDHDWGVDFYIWVTENDRDRIAELADWKRRLMYFNPPPFARTQSQYGATISVMTCGDFFIQLIGVPDYPTDVLAWFRIPENNVAMCVNGEVFMDNAGEFTAIRNRFLQYFPEDFRLKKIAAKCMAIAQTGQYNHKRMNDRNEFVTVSTVISRFVDNVTGLVFLLNRVYRPYYKWENRMMRSLPILGEEIASLILRLLSLPLIDEDAFENRQVVIDEICFKLAGELKAQNLADTHDTFFTVHGEQVQSRIQHSVIRSLPAQYE